MKDSPSGTYVIDENYRIVSYNDIAKELYPQLTLGEHCYKCLMNLEEPCSVCPVLNQVNGPKTYFDPIRELYETVDAVPMYDRYGNPLHALVFSTTGKREEYARQLPTTQNELDSLYEQEYHDFLTGGPSMKGFLRDGEKLLRESPADQQFAILYFNIRNFKAINDLFGFDGGNLVLRQVYMSILQTPKPPMLVSRIMADHFVCLFDQEDLDLEYYIDNAAQTWNCAGRTVRIHSNSGLYVIEDKTLSLSSMIDRARLALHHIVDEYVQPYAVFDEAMQREFIDKAQVLAEFETALQEGQFIPYYQPIVRAETGRVVASEVLVRWEKPDGSIVMPGTFIPALESTGHISQLDRYMIEQVHRRMVGEYETTGTVMSVSINLSWMDFYDVQMRAYILDLVKHSPLPAGALRFETTETAFNTLEDSCKSFLDSLRKAGCQILLDDYGVGYSSLSALQNFDFDVLKIDMKFIRQIRTSPKARNIICAIIAMCHEMGLQTVAEGVEDQSEYEFLRLNHCDYIQGYYFSKPLPTSDFLTHVAKNHAEKLDESYLQKLIAPVALSELPPEDTSPDLLEMILDKSDRFVQVCDPETMEMIYANRATRNISGKPQQDYHGQKCHAYMLGLDHMCPHCPLRLMGDATDKVMEVDDGNFVFALKASYINYHGKRLFLEVGSDITDMKQAEKKYDSQIRSILRSVPEEQGIFHLDITDDRWLSSNGNAKNARELQNIENVDMLIRQISLFVPDEADRKVFFTTFNREAMQRAFEQGMDEITLETKSYYDDLSIRDTRMIACLAVNPKNDHLEAILHGLDISKEKSDEARLNEKLATLKELSERAIANAEVKFAKADHDRRVDFLTGLRNRLDLFERIQASLSGTAPEIKAMYMLDVDDFKAYNDHYGHVAGDDCLRTISQRLIAYGAHNRITFFRYGGEEILGIGSHTEKPASQIAHEIIKAVEALDLKRDDNKFGYTTISLGYTTNNARYEKMINRADTALYRAKLLGKNRSVCYEDLPE